MVKQPGCVTVSGLASPLGNERYLTVHKENLDEPSADAPVVDAFGAAGGSIVK
jgi:hypothetical protein